MSITQTWIARETNFLPSRDDFKQDVETNWRTANIQTLLTESIFKLDSI